MNWGNRFHLHETPQLQKLRASHFLSLQVLPGLQKWNRTINLLQQRSLNPQTKLNCNTSYWPEFHSDIPLKLEFLQLWSRSKKSYFLSTALLPPTRLFSFESIQLLQSPKVVATKSLLYTLQWASLPEFFLFDQGVFSTGLSISFQEAVQQIISTRFISRLAMNVREKIVCACPFYLCSPFSE